MTVHEQLLQYWSDKIATDIVSKTIDVLIKQTNLIWNESKYIQNNWEEYCIYASYNDLPPYIVEQHKLNIEALFYKFYRDLCKEEKYTLWLESEEGGEWYYSENNRFNESFELEDDPCFIANYTKILMPEIHRLADAYGYVNKNIMNYRTYEC